MAADIPDLLHQTVYHHLIRHGLLNSLTLLPLLVPQDTCLFDTS